MEARCLCFPGFLIAQQVLIVLPEGVEVHQTGDERRDDQHGHAYAHSNPPDLAIDNQHDLLRGAPA